MHDETAHDGVVCTIAAGESKRDNRYSLCALEEARCAFSDGIEFKCVRIDDSFRSKNRCSNVIVAHSDQTFDNFGFLTLKQLPIITQFIFILTFIKAFSKEIKTNKETNKEYNRYYVNVTRRKFFVS